MAKPIYPHCGRVDNFSLIYCEMAMEAYYHASQMLDEIKKKNYSAIEGAIEWDALGKDVIKTVAFSAMTIEAFFNDYAAACLGDSEFYGSFDQLSPISKFELISVFGLDLSVGELAVYGYLPYREDRESFECWPSSRTIGATLCMSRNTVMKYVHRLEVKEFIVTEPTQVRRGDGSKWNGNLKYRVRPIQSVIKAWNARQARKAKQESMLLRAKQIAAHRSGFTVSESIPTGRR